MSTVAGALNLNTDLAIACILNFTLFVALKTYQLPREPVMVISE